MLTTDSAVLIRDRRHYFREDLAGSRVEYSEEQNNPVPMKWLCLASFALPVSAASAQNLVPNGSFEAHTDCPDFANQISRATGWLSYRESPDYFHECATGGSVGVPLNWAGEQVAAHGSAYAGVLSWRQDAVNVREHLGIELSEALIPGMPVYLSFKMVAAIGRDSVVDGLLFNARWSCDKVGLRLGTNPQPQMGNSSLPNQAHLYAPEAPLDTTNWITTSSFFTPDSAYTHLLVGNFFDDALVDPVLFNPSGLGEYAYVLIDEVCVGYDPADCDFAAETRSQNPTSFHLYPNPSTEDVNVLLSRSFPNPINVWMSDASGRTLWSNELPAGCTRFHIESNVLGSGAFVLHGQDLELVIPPVKFFHL